MQNLRNVQKAVVQLSNLFPDRTNAIGVVLGTGLGGWEESLHGIQLSYSEIDGFPISTVEGHSGTLIAGKKNGRRVFVMSGRFHLYEGYGPAEICMGVRTLAQLGVSQIILTNAAGALNPQFITGSLMLITDHINFTGHTPLRGPNIDSWGVRFPDMRNVWSQRLRNIAEEEAVESGIRLERGVYVQVPGPQMETPAETRMYRTLGADAIGMSTALEAIAAHHMGVELLGISCLTNKNLPDCMEETSLEIVLNRAQKSAGILGRLLDGLLVRI